MYELHRVQQGSGGIYIYIQDAYTVTEVATVVRCILMVIGYPRPPGLGDNTEGGGNGGGLS